MTPQEKLALGLLAFLVFFVIALLLVPRDVYDAYFSSFTSRARRILIKSFVVGVFALGFPYFYEVLVGFDNRGLAQALQLPLMVAAYGVLIDVARFIVTTYCMRAFMRWRR